MRIAVVTSDFASNCLGRAWVLARVLSRDHHVAICGPQRGPAIWSPVAGDRTVPYLPVRDRSVLRSFVPVLRRIREARPDAIYAIKPRFSTYWAGLWLRGVSGVRLVLDVDDWELGFLLESRAPAAGRGAWGRLGWRLDRTAARAWCAANEPLIRLADALTVSNGFLKRRFGGVVVPHGRDLAAFDPERIDGAAVRREFGVAPGRRVVMFLGTPRIHKGLDLLVDAVAALAGEDLLLVIAGLEEGSPVRDYAIRRLGDRFVGLGRFPIPRVPELLKMADVVVIPQRSGAATAGQVPAKLFDAMAMGRPVVASDLPPIREVLGACGWLCDPDSAPDLARALRAALRDPGEAARRGREARRRCRERYSWEAMGTTLGRLFPPDDGGGAPGGRAAFALPS